jgi:hypothetical protein
MVTAVDVLMTLTVPGVPAPGPRMVWLPHSDPRRGWPGRPGVHGADPALAAPATGDNSQTAAAR